MGFQPRDHPQLAKSAPELLIITPAESERNKTCPDFASDSRRGGIRSDHGLLTLPDFDGVNEPSCALSDQPPTESFRAVATPVLRGSNDDQTTGRAARLRGKDSRSKSFMRRIGKLNQPVSSSSTLLATSQALRNVFQRERSALEFTLNKKSGSKAADSILCSAPDDFVGPLAEIFPTGLIDQPSRHANQEERWTEVMAKNVRWPGHHAEESGLVTFWQASLVFAREIRLALRALVHMAKKGSVGDWMVGIVLLTLGQLVNSLNLSWEIDHAKHIKNVDEARQRRINMIGLQHRHQQMQNKLWGVIELLDSADKKKGMISERHTVAALEKYEDALMYLLYTGKIILEDSLIFYRTNFCQSAFRGLGHAGLEPPLLAGLIQWDQGLTETALAYMVALTPPSQLMKRFTALGYSPLYISTTLRITGAKYKHTYLKPLYRLIKSGAHGRPSNGSSGTIMRHSI